MSNIEVNIIHLRNTDWSQHRFDSFTKEMNEQGINNYKVWDGIHEANKIRAISCSHKQIVQYAKEKQLPEICIMEDDCFFTGRGAFEYYIQNKPIEFDIWLGGLSNLLKRKDDYITDFRGLLLYIVNERFYDKFLSVPENVNIDAGLKGLGKYYLCPKVVCGERPGFSYHRKKNVDRTRLLNQFDVYEGK